MRYSSAMMMGALTALRGSWPERMERTCSQTSIETFSWASAVEAPRWGVATTLGWAISFAAIPAAVGGSDVKTSMPAPAITPVSRASRILASSIMPPRATLSTRALFFIFLSSFKPIMPLVEAIIGV